MLNTKEENVSLIADGVKNVNIQRINNYSDSRKSFSQFWSNSSKHRPTQRIKKCTIYKAAKEPFIWHKAIECSYIDAVKRSDFAKIYWLEYEQDSEYENDKLSMRVLSWCFSNW